MLPILNKVVAGGETVFPEADNIPRLFGSSKDQDIKREGMPSCGKGFAIPPIERGAAIFYHLHPTGEADILSTHGGCPPLKGSVKYAINIFCWNRDFFSSYNKVLDKFD